MRSDDPFTGTWTLNHSKSASSFPLPHSWVQSVESNTEELSLREDIVPPNDTQFTVSLQAAFDGKDYPVTGSHVADTMAYTRPDSNTIRGTGKQKGEVTLRDTISVSPAGDYLTILLSLYSGSREFASATLVFDKF